MKPVCIFLQGPSVIKAPIKELEKKDVILASLNRFDLLEEGLNIKFDIIWLSSEERRIQLIKKFGHVPLFCDESRTFMDHEDSKYAFGFSSLFAFLCCLIKHGYTEFYLFGADGGKVIGKPLYYNEINMNEDIKARTNSIQKDTYIMNEMFWKLINYWGLGSKENIRIYNSTPNSLLICFDFIDNSQLLARLS